MLSYAILGAAYAFAAAVQPGQFQAYVVSQAIANGWRRTMPAALAPLLSDVFIVVLVLAILTQIPLLFLLVLRLVGGFFLLYLAWGAFRTYRGTVESMAAPPSAAHKTVLEAAFVNILNPNPYLAWALVLGPLLLEAWKKSPSYGVVLVAAFYLTIIVATAAIILLAALARSFGPKVSRALVGISAVALVCFAIYQLSAVSMALVEMG
ncbi:MAG: LysE family translocator [Thermoanaerobaculia bacterium]|nr:LysE family translocator [Thermoanaerobaculia bacterium]